MTREESWIPKISRTANVNKLALSPEEGYLLSRIDGATTVDQLRQITGLPAQHINTILGRLTEEGALETTAQLSPSRGTTPTPHRKRSDPVSRDISELDPSALTELDGDALQPLNNASDAYESLDIDVAPLDPAALTALDGDALQPLNDASGAYEPLDIDVVPLDPADDQDAELLSQALEPEQDAVLEPDTDEEIVLNTGSYRKLFETRLHGLPRDQRTQLAVSAEDPYLSAFCFDPDPRVIRSVLENALCGLEHARLVAAEHRNAAGLQLFIQRRSFLTDAWVQSLLLRNPQLPDSLFQSFMAHKPMLHLFKTVNSREVTDRARTSARRLLRRKFTHQSTPEDCVELIFSTNGRVLSTLAGIHFNSQTVAALRNRPYHSVLLVQNLARFATTPAPLLLHLLKQSIVRNQSMLRKLILQHPNLPSDARRREQMLKGSQK